MWQVDDSIYLGGGTPSLMEADHLARLGQVLQQHFGVSQQSMSANQLEFTCEFMPGTHSEPKLLAMADIGVSRLSVGLQSLQESELKELGRAHTLRDISESLQLIQDLSPKFSKRGLDWVNLDLLMGTPNQTLHSYLESLQLLVAYKPGHISSYILEIHESTPFGAKFAESVSPLPPTDAVCEMFKQGRQFLGTTGFQMYQVSNYSSTEANESRHNKMYWEGDIPYLAFGSGAASLYGGKRITRPKNVQSYARFVKCLAEVLNQVKSTNESETKEKFWNLVRAIPDVHIGEEERPAAVAQSLLIGGLSTVKGVHIDRLLRVIPDLAYVLTDSFRVVLGDIEQSSVARNKAEMMLFELIEVNPLLNQRLEIKDRWIRPRGDEGLLVSDGLVFELSEVIDKICSEVNSPLRILKL